MVSTPQPAIEVVEHSLEESQKACAERALSTLVARDNSATQSMTPSEQLILKSKEWGWLEGIHSWRLARLGGSTTAPENIPMP